MPDGTPVAVKRTDYDARLEAEGLEALLAAGAPTPQLFEVGPTELVMQWIEGPAEWDRLGRALASAHRASASAFGWHRDNVIGPLPQHNAWHDSWGQFFAERRVLPHLDDAAIPDAHRSRLEKACDGRLQELLESHRPDPSLVHGDLWSGNIVDGRAIIDPAVCYADREMDLAFLEFFGGVPRAFTEAYTDEWPLPAGWERRRPALQLHHCLVHVRLFGGSYLPRLEAILSASGW